MLYHLSEVLNVISLNMYLDCMMILNAIDVSMATPSLFVFMVALLLQNVIELVAVNAFIHKMYQSIVFNSYLLYCDLIEDI